MRSMKEGYFQRLEFVRDRIVGFYRGIDRVNCTKHEIQEYHLFLDRDNNWQLVCCRCKAEVFPDIKSAVPAKSERCQTIQCYCTNDAVAVCIACKKDFCNTHMEDHKLCSDCLQKFLLKEADAHGPDGPRKFHEC